LALDAVQLGDAATTAGSLVATWMLARRWPENWLVWMVVNSGASALFLFQGLYPTAALYVLLTIMAAWGWWRWRCQADGAVKWAR
jgi:nicotinamide mononucleotide transporter